MVKYIVHSIEKTCCPTCGAGDDKLFVRRKYVGKVYKAGVYRDNFKFDGYDCSECGEEIRFKY